MENSHPYFPCVPRYAREFKLLMDAVKMLHPSQSRSTSGWRLSGNMPIGGIEVNVDFNFTEITDRDVASAGASSLNDYLMAKGDPTYCFALTPNYEVKVGEASVYKLVNNYLGTAVVPIIARLSGIVVRDGEETPGMGVHLAKKGCVDLSKEDDDDDSDDHMSVEDDDQMAT